MSSPPKEVGAEVELKGGHAPAAKVGGMRVVDKKHETKDKPDKDGDKAAEANANVPENEAALPTDKELTSGAGSNGERDFPAAALKSFHDKPMPSVQPSHAPAPRHINQPRKQ